MSNQNKKHAGRKVIQTMLFIVLIGLVFSPADIIADVLPVVGNIDDGLYAIAAIVNAFTFPKKVDA